MRIRSGSGIQGAGTRSVVVRVIAPIPPRFVDPAPDESVECALLHMMKCDGTIIHGRLAQG